MESYVGPLHTVPREDLSGFALLEAPAMLPTVSLMTHWKSEGS